MLDRLRLDEREEIRINLVLVGRAQAVRRARIDFQHRTFDDLGREKGRCADRHDLIVAAVDDECWHVELLQVFSEIGLGEGLDAVEDVFETRQHSLEPERVSQALRDLGARPVGAIERRGEILEELRAIPEHAGADIVENINR